MTFNKEELDTIADAIEVWEQGNGAGQLMASIVGAMISRNNPEAQATFDRMEAEKERKLEADKRQRKEIGTLLKAKIIMMKKEII